MELTIANSTLTDNVYSWNVPFSNYKIQSISVVSSAISFNAKYNDEVMQYLESGRPDDSCPAIFSGNFSVYFFTIFPFFVKQDVEDIHIELVPV